MQGKLFLSQFLEAKASRARGHSGHEAPPMTHSLVLTPFHEKEPVSETISTMPQVLSQKLDSLFAERSLCPARATHT